MKSTRKRKALIHKDHLVCVVMWVKFFFSYTRDNLSIGTICYNSSIATHGKKMHKKFILGVIWRPMVGNCPKTATKNLQWTTKFIYTFSPISYNGPVAANGWNAQVFSRLNVILSDPYFVTTLMQCLLSCYNFYT